MKFHWQSYLCINDNYFNRHYIFLRWKKLIDCIISYIFLTPVIFSLFNPCTLLVIDYVYVLDLQHKVEPAKKFWEEYDLSLLQLDVQVPRYLLTQTRQYGLLLVRLLAWRWLEMLLLREISRGEGLFAFRCRLGVVLALFLVTCWLGGGGPKAQGGIQGVRLDVEVRPWQKVYDGEVYVHLVDEGGRETQVQGWKPT